MLSSLIEQIWRSSWQGAVLAVLVFAVCWLFRGRLSANWRYLFLCIVLLRFMLPVVPASNFSLFALFDRTESPKLEIIDHTEMPEIAAQPTRPTKSAPKKSSPQPITPAYQEFVETEQPEFAKTYEILPATNNEIPNFAADESRPALEKTEIAAEIPAEVAAIDYFGAAIKFGVAIWVIGVILMAVRLLRDELVLLRGMKKWQAANSPELLAAFADCLKKLKIRRKIALFIAEGNIGAASCGIFRPKILLSGRILENLASEQVRLILSHEILHHKRLDPLVHLLARVITVIHWPNPLAWLLAGRLRVEMELAVDDSVVRLHGQKESVHYGNAILGIVRESFLVVPSPGLLGIRSGDRILERRIQMILNPHKSTWLQITLGAAIFGLLLLCGLSETPPERRVEASYENANNVSSISKLIFVESSYATEIDMDVIKRITVKGLVLADDGRPVPGAKLVLIPYLNEKLPLTKTADNKGEFEFSVDLNGNEPFNLIAVSPDEKIFGTMRILAEELDFVQKNVPHHNSKDPKWVDGRFLVKLDSPCCTVKGKLKDASGNPVSGAILRGGGFRAITVADGSFEMYYGKFHPQSVYAIVPGKGFAFVQWFSGKLKGGEDTGNPFLKPIELVLHEAKPLNILLTDSDGRPLPNRKLRLSMRYLFDYGDQLEYMTDAKGMIRADWVPDTEEFDIVFTLLSSRQFKVNGEERVGNYPIKSISTRNRPEGELLVAIIPRETTMSIVIENPFINENKAVELPDVDFWIGGSPYRLEKKNYANKPRLEFSFFGMAEEKYQITFPPKPSPGVVSSVRIEGKLGENGEKRTFKLEKGVLVKARLFDLEGNPVKFRQNAEVKLAAYDGGSFSFFERKREDAPYGTGEAGSWPENEFRNYIPRGSFIMDASLANTTMQQQQAATPQQAIPQSIRLPQAPVKRIKDPMRRFTVEDQEEIVFDFQIGFFDENQPQRPEQREQPKSNLALPIGAEIVDDSQDIHVSLSKWYQSEESYFDRLSLGAACDEAEALAILERELKTGRYKTLFIDDGDKRAFGDDPALGLMKGVNELAKKYGLEPEYHVAMSSFGPDDEEERKKGASREVFPAEIGIDIPHRGDKAFDLKDGKPYRVLLRTSMNANTMEEREALARIADEIEKGKRQRIVLECDESVPYEKVQAVIKKLQLNGIRVFSMKVK